MAIEPLPDYILTDAASADMHTHRVTEDEVLAALECWWENRPPNPSIPPVGPRGFTDPESGVFLTIDYDPLGDHPLVVMHVRIS